jgi:hypothetical protein
LSWGASPGATGYIIKRSEFPGGATPYATTAATSYVDTGVTIGNTYYYVVSATNAVGESVNSLEKSSLIIAGGTFNITSQPSDQAACEYTTATFSVTASEPDLSYNWQYSTDGGVAWSDLGGVNSNYTTWPVTTTDNGTKYRVVVSSPCTSQISEVATLTVTTPATITRQPFSQSVPTNWAAVFSVQASGGLLSYQWFRDGTPLTDGATVSGATTNVLTLSGLAPGDSGATLECVVSNLCGTASTSSPPATLTILANPLQLHFAFEDVGTTTTDSVASVSLDMVDALGASTDLHGADGSGVAGQGRALDLRSAAAQGGTGPLISTWSNSVVDFGSIGSFTITLWVKPAADLLINGYPRFFVLGTNSATDRWATNSLGLLSNGYLQPTNTAVQGAVNQFGTSTSAFGALELPTNQWRFLALTYDGAAVRAYGGSEINPASLLSSQALLQGGPVEVGNSWNLFLGNNGLTNRAFRGEMDDVRFFLGAAPLADVEAIRQAVVPPVAPVITTAVTGTNLWLLVDTVTGRDYVLESTPVLAPTPLWTSVSTNAGNGGVLTNSVPLNPALPQTYFRYLVR